MEQENNKNKWEEFFQSLQMTYYSLLAAPLLIFAIAFLRAENGNDKFIYLSEDKETLLVSTIAILALLTMVFTFIFTRKVYKQATLINDLEEKLKVYRKTILTKYVSLSIMQVITVIVFAVTYHNGMMGVFTALLLFASFFRPELSTARRSLRLSKKEFEQINYKSSIIS